MVNTISLVGTDDALLTAYDMSGNILDFTFLDNSTSIVALT